MLYEEDIELLNENNIDSKGITSLNDNINVNIESRYGITVNKFVKLLNNAGFLKSLKLIRKQKYSQCFYFDDINNKCRIHEDKPLICYLFPYVMSMSRDNISFDDKCLFTSKLSIKDREDLARMKSYNEYRFAIILFGLDKGHISIKDRETITVKLPPWFSQDQYHI